jgi:hypothetical protein
MTGTEPSQTATDRKRNSALISGEFGSGSLALNLAPERIDWHFTDVEPQFGIEGVGPIIESWASFSALAERWLVEDDVPVIHRLAFGAVLLHGEEDLAAGYRRLPDYLPITVDPEWRDFLFQINVQNKLPNGKYAVNYLNRLSRWSVASRSINKLTMDAHGLSTMGIGVPQFALRLELDVNSPAEFLEPIPGPQLVMLYQEALEAARAIALDGVSHEQYKL